MLAENDNNVGLPNFKSTCFINSAIQMLFRIDSIKLYIMYYSENSKNSVIISLRNIFKLLSNSSKKKIELKNIHDDIFLLYKIIIRNIPSINQMEQQDSQEFLTAIFHIILEEAKYLRKFFLLKIIRETYCKDKNNLIYEKQSPNLEETFVLNLQIPERGEFYTIQSLIDEKYINIEELLDSPLKTNNFILENGERIYYQKRCKDKDNSYRFINIKIPNKLTYLFIQLSRNRFIGTQSFFIEDWVYVNKIITIHNINFILKGCILKIGTVMGGHYIYVSFENGKIHKVFNDNFVSNVLPTDFNLHKNAYLILYEKYENNNNINNNSNLINTFTRYEKNLENFKKREEEKISKNYIQYLMAQNKGENLSNMKEYTNLMEKENLNKYNNKLAALKNFIENLNNNNSNSPFFLFYKYSNNNGKKNLNELIKIIDILDTPSNDRVELEYNTIKNIINIYNKNSLEYYILTILKVNRNLFINFNLNSDQLTELVNIILKNNNINYSNSYIKKLIKNLFGHKNKNS